MAPGRVTCWSAVPTRFSTALDRGRIRVYIAANMEADYQRLSVETLSEQLGDEVRQTLRSFDATSITYFDRRGPHTHLFGLTAGKDRRDWQARVDFNNDEDAAEGLVLESDSGAIKLSTYNKQPTRGGGFEIVWQHDNEVRAGDIYCIKAWLKEVKSPRRTGRLRVTRRPEGLRAFIAKLLTREVRS